MEARFNTYAEALAYFNKQVRTYGSNKYRASEEYRTFRPIFEALRNAESVQQPKRRKLKGADLRPMWMVAQSQGII